MTAKVSGNALKQGMEHTQCYVCAILKCKKQGCANVWSNSSRSEGMWVGWRTPRIDSLKLAKLCKNWECACMQHARKLSFWWCGCYMYNY